MTYIPSRLRGDKYETRHETDELDRVRDWPGSQDTEAEFDDSGVEAIEPGWLQREVERAAAVTAEAVRVRREEELGGITRRRKHGKRT